MTTNNSNVKEIDKGIENHDRTQINNPYEWCTISAIEDDLTYHFSSKCDFQIDDETRVIYINHPYLEYAIRFLFLINLSRTPPKFEIFQRDIPHKLLEILTNLDSTTVNSIMTNVVRRILESVNPLYFHTNGIYGRVKWKVIN